MTDFDALQRAIGASLSSRQAEARACEACLTALYQALRHANGPGLPLNNVMMEPASDLFRSIKPAPLGSWHAAWFRLGLCELRVQVRREGSDFVGEYGPSGHFRIHLLSEMEMLGLGREVLSQLIRLYDADAQLSRLKN
ncbi:hypothetical protein FNU79_13175 [Deinococcus detaillensis]|uniref:Uncharacterized protein n=1 Tax=Deinococcus detaillensis TaxID=2592048 RepID=A0A553UST3_9DEIO|nr:hypothetical protein [Deinococcus detaillensis]TSA83061.1 hypothetical protein FNU79_13175 [Deinococcus detaillensis]